MKKILILSLLLVVLLFTGCSNKDCATCDYSSSDLTGIIDGIYENIGSENMPMVATIESDITDLDALNYNTGLSSNENIEYVVVSEPMMSSQAYSFVLVKVKDLSSVEGVKEEIFNNINTRKWVCVEAEMLYVNNYDTVISIIMTNEELGNKLKSEFESLAGSNLGTEKIRNIEI